MVFDFCIAARDHRVESEMGRKPRDKKRSDLLCILESSLSIFTCENEFHEMARGREVERFPDFNLFTEESRIVKTGGMLDGGMIRKLRLEEHFAFETAPTGAA